MKIFIVWFIIFALMICVKIPKAVKKSKVKRRKNQLYINNEFVKGNIERIVKENNEFRKSFLIKIFLLVLAFLSFLAFACFMRSIELCIFWGMFGAFALLFPISKYRSDYEVGFKEKVVTKIIKKYNPNLGYFPRDGFSKEEYDRCKFNETYDTYSSEDLIINKLDNFRCADILIQSEYTDSDGDTHTTIEYQGSLASIDIKDCKCEVYLGNVKKNIFKLDSIQAIKLENEEFNKLFSVFSNNELNAYKLLTPDVMEQFVYIKKNTYGDIDIRIINDKLYIRFLSGDGFAPDLFKPKREIKNISSSIAVLEEIINAMNNVKNIINKKGI